MKKTTKICLTALAGSCALVAAISLAACGNDNRMKAESHAHSYGGWRIVAPTKTTEGSAEKVCPNCGETEKGHKITVVLPQLTDGRYTVTGDTATCEAAGVATYGITLDGYEIEFSAATDATGHKLGEKVDATDPTCDQPGNPEYYQCSKCNCYFSDAQGEHQLDSIVTPAKGHSFLCTDLPEPQPEGGKLSMTCQNGCGTTRDMYYNGTLDCGTTSTDAPAEITENGTYYLKATTASVFFKIPITKAGTYRIDFTNLDPTRSMTLGINLSNRCAVLVYSSTGTVLARATATTTFKPQTEGLTGGYVKSGTVLSVSWIQYVAGKDAEGGYIIFQLCPADAASTNAFPFIMEVGYDEGAQAEDIALTPAEYAYDPRKNV